MNNGKEQKEAFASRWKAPAAKKPNEANSRSNSFVRGHTESMTSVKSKVQQSSKSIKVELKKERIELCTKSSSAILNRAKDASSNPKANALKRKFEDVPLVQSMTLKKTKITNSNDENKIAMFKHHGVEKPKVEMTKLTVERKTMERGMTIHCALVNIDGRRSISEGE